MASSPMLLSVLKQVLTRPSLVIGLIKLLLVHDRQRASDGLPVAICTTPIHRLIRFGWNETQLVDPRWSSYSIWMIFSETAFLAINSLWG